MAGGLLRPTADALCPCENNLVEAFNVDFFIINSVSFVAPPFWRGDGVARLIRERVRNERLTRLLLRLDDMFLTVIKELQQTVVTELKAASADGRIGREERRCIKEAAVRQVTTAGVRPCRARHGFAGRATIEVRLPASSLRMGP